MGHDILDLFGRLSVANHDFYYRYELVTTHYTSLFFLSKIALFHVKTEQRYSFKRYTSITFSMSEIQAHPR